MRTGGAGLPIHHGCRKACSGRGGGRRECGVGAGGAGVIGGAGSGGRGAGRWGGNTVILAHAGVHAICRRELGGAICFSLPFRIRVSFPWSFP